MRAKSLALLILALGCGLVASIGITQVMAKRSAEPAAGLTDAVPICVVMKDISLGEPLSAKVLRLEPWPKDKIPAGALTRIEDAEGRCTRQRLYAGEPILENKLFAKGDSRANASMLIPKGLRVVPVRVDAVSGGNLILPGDRVDVLVYLSHSAGIQETSTKTILEDIKVFAVNDQFNQDTKDSDEKSIKAATISLLVTPEQAEKVTLASELGKIRLVMRGHEDDSHPASKGVSPRELFGGGPEAGQRSKETLVEPSSAEKRDNDGFLKFLKGMRTKTSPDQEKAPEKSSAPKEVVAPPTWTVRILAGNDVKDVTLQLENATAGTETGEGKWKANGSAATSHPSKEPAKAGNAAESGAKPATEAEQPAAPEKQDPQKKDSSAPAETSRPGNQ